MLPFFGNTRIAGTHRLAILLLSASAAFGQTCSPNAGTLPIHAEGYAEKLADVVITCSGGTAGTAVAGSLFVSYSANIANRLDSSGAPSGITISIAGAAGSATDPTLNNPTLLFSNVRYTVPAGAGAVTITVSGVRAGLGTSSTVNQPITAAVALTGLQSLSSGVPFVVGASSPSLLSTVFNNGLPCGGSPLPNPTDFGTFATTSLSSIIRVTESSVFAFQPKDPSADSGVRLVVQISGYGTGIRAFVPDVIVGSNGTAATSAASYLAPVGGGTYTPGSNQLLLVRVSGADANGAGGSPLFGAPTTATSFTSMTELTVVNGAATVVYEVMDANTAVRETAQIPVFFVYAANNCSTAAQTALSAILGPISTVSGASATAPIPRFIAVLPPSDCSVVNDCTAFYFPKLQVDQSAIVLAGTSLGPLQIAPLRVGNAGAGQMVFTASVAYPPGQATGWLTVSPTSGINSVTITAVADPGSLAQGSYSATITVNAGAAGQATVLVTFNVGPAGPTIQAVVNAASFLAGPVVPGSYVALFGLNLGGTDVGVTFNGISAAVLYKSSTQLNLLIPNTLAAQSTANVVATIDGKQSNTYRAALAPNAPGIFTPGIVNADGTVNTASQSAPLGSTVAIYLTGMTTPLTGQATVNIGNATGTISYAGAQGTFPGLVQINVQIPQSLTAGTLPLFVCIPGLTGQPVCSNTVSLYTR